MSEARPTFGGRGPTVGVLDEEERRAVQRLFGVAAEQVARDHVVSHALAAIAELGPDHVVFFGGTALSRTHLPQTRLSEDIDLIALGERRHVAQQIEGILSRRLGRLFGAVQFTPRLIESRHPHASVLQVGETRIQVQLVSAVGYPAWPTEVVSIEQRYGDAPPAHLRVLTAASFVASKLAAWSDRGAARDLYDLWVLAEASKITAEALDIFRRLGPLTSASKVSFVGVPTHTEWTRALGHQCLVRVTPDVAVAVVEAALESAAGGAEALTRET